MERRLTPRSVSVELAGSRLLLLLLLNLLGASRENDESFPRRVRRGSTPRQDGVHETIQHLPLDCRLKWRQAFNGDPARRLQRRLDEVSSASSVAPRTEQKRLERVTHRAPSLFDAAHRGRFIAPRGVRAPLAAAMQRVAGRRGVSSSEAPPVPAPFPRRHRRPGPLVAPNVAARSSAGTRASRYMFANAAHAA